MISPLDGAYSDDTWLCSPTRRFFRRGRNLCRRAPKQLSVSSFRTFCSAARVGVAILALTPVLALLGLAPLASGQPVQYCAQLSIVQGIPPWGFHTGSPITGPTGSYARGHGDISLTANTVSGTLCQVDRVRNQPDRLIMMTVEHHLVYHSHFAVMWGFPGNIMKIIVRVASSTDPRCQVGTIGRVTLFASYNGVRSDSVQFSFPRGCSDHDHVYHGPQVNNQVPPL
jgi:hypothetical protein